MKQTNTHTHTTDTAPDSVPRSLLLPLTKGYAEWHHRLWERWLTLRLCGTTVVCFACLAVAARHTVPYDPYRVADGMTYAQVVSLTDQLLYA